MSKKWETEIDSDIGRLQLTVTYDLDGGSKGDYYNPPEPPYVSIIDYEVTLLDEPPAQVMDWIVEEIEDEFVRS
jgi:hypothetical protein